MCLCFSTNWLSGVYVVSKAAFGFQFLAFGSWLLAFGFLANSQQLTANSLLTFIFKSTVKSLNFRQETDTYKRPGNPITQ